MSEENLNHQLENQNMPVSMPMGIVGQAGQINNSQQGVGQGLMPLGDLIGQAFGLYRKKLKILSQVIAPLAAAGFGSVFFEWLQKFSQTNNLQLTYDVVSIVLPLFSLVLLVATVWSAPAMILVLANDNLGFKEAYRQASRKILANAWLSALSGLVILGGFMVFIVPGVIFSVWFSFIVYILVLENLRGRDALLKSKFYVRGYWWSILGRQLVFALLLAVGAGGVLAIAGLAVYLLKIFAPQATGLVSIIGQPMFTLLLAPLSFCFLYLLYQNVKAVKANQNFEIKPNAKKFLIVWAVWGVVSWLLLFLLVAALVWFITSSSGNWPAKFRDAVRQNNQKQLWFDLNFYHQQKQRYPSSIEGPSEVGVAPPRDPQTSQPYEYKTTEDGQNFELCIIFEQSDKGRQCIDKSINPDIIKTINLNQASPRPLSWKQFLKISQQSSFVLIGAKNLLGH